MAKAYIGLNGLTVMGEKLILNMETKGFTVASFNRIVSKVDNIIEGRVKDRNIIAYHSIEKLAENFVKPSKVILIVKFSEAVDNFIEHLHPQHEASEIVIDDSNPHLPDTMCQIGFIESQGKFHIHTSILIDEEEMSRGEQASAQSDTEARTRSSWASNWLRLSNIMKSHLSPISKRMRGGKRF